MGYSKEDKEKLSRFYLHLGFMAHSLRNLVGGEYTGSDLVELYRLYLEHFAEDEYEE